MSTSASTLPSSTVSEGTCVVCGKATPFRCQTCAANGTNWMFFCGKEHQKLLWKKVHSPVCGVRSNPFRWPGLSESEVDGLRDIDNYEKDNEDRIWLYKFISTLRRADGERSGFETLLDAFSNKKIEDPISFERTSFSVVIRSLLFDTKFSKYKEEAKCQEDMLINIARYSLTCPFSYLASVVVRLHLYNEAQPIAPWVAELQHRLLNYIYIKAFDVVELPEAVEGGADCAIEGIKKFAKEVVAKTHPETAEKILKIWEQR